MRYNTKRKIKKIVVYGGLLLIVFIIGSCFSDASLLKEIDSTVDFIDHTNLSKIIGVGNSKLSIGDTGVSDGLEISVIEVSLIDPDDIPSVVWVGSSLRRIDQQAKLLNVYIKVENIAKVRTGHNTIVRGIGYEPSTDDRISVYYEEQRMKDVSLRATGISDDVFGRPFFSGYGEQYPGVVKDGLVSFEVPKNIDLSRAVIEIHGLEWSLG